MPKISQPSQDIAQQLLIHIARPACCGQPVHAERATLENAVMLPTHPAGNVQQLCVNAGVVPRFSRRLRTGYAQAKSAILQIIIDLIPTIHTAYNTEQQIYLMD